MREQKVKEYLSTIYMLSSYGCVRGSYIASEMMLSRPSVSVALKALAQEGYLTVDHDHLIHLTAKGEQKAKESICETVDRGNELSMIAKQIQGERDVLPEKAEERKKEQLFRLLAKDQAQDILEAILILSKRFYSVRIIDISQFLERNSASVRSVVARLEKYGLVNRGEETTVNLTKEGKTLAEQLYKQHEDVRSELMQACTELFEAERKSISNQC